MMKTKNGKTLGIKDLIIDLLKIKKMV
uniref:Uncharacterized protein n=1 Tax=Aquilaria malaccensis TaxID=223753 RepID=A0A4Y6GLR2_9ROSI|nr:hypothetical protein [Aquilaria malaccensis]